MAKKLPNMVVLQAAVQDAGYMYYFDRNGTARDYAVIKMFGQSVFNPLSKIEIEPSKSTPNDLVHLRFVHTNKYWSVNDGWATILAIKDKPDESPTSPSCTLFRPRVHGDKLYLYHVYSQKPVIATRYGLDIDLNHGGGAALSDQHAFLWTDIEDLVKFPKMVAFKGYNDKYLKSVQWSYPYLQFSSDDPNRKDTAHAVEVMDNGYIRIKSLYFEKFWRLSPSWIWPDTTDERDRDTWFKPIKVGDKIVLQNVSNGRFCESLTIDGKEDCLNAYIDSMVKETKMEVVDLVSESKLNNIKFMTDFSRVFDEKPYVMGETTAINESDEEAKVQVKVSKIEKTTQTFSAGVSFTAGFKVSVNIGPDVVKLGSVESSVSVTGTYTVGNAREDSITLECIATVSVPKKSKAICECLGTKGRTSVPFSYTREDKSSYDGDVSRDDHIDGIFNAVEYFGFHIRVREIQPL